MKKFFGKIQNYINESYTELVQKVTWPSWNELQGSAITVMVASVVIAIVVLIMDLIFKYGMTFIYSMFS
jgi:preprotein translocase subunit SecE